MGEAERGVRQVDAVLVEVDAELVDGVVELDAVLVLLLALVELLEPRLSVL